MPMSLEDVDALRIQPGMLPKANEEEDPNAFSGQAIDLNPDALKMAFASLAEELQPHKPSIAGILAQPVFRVSANTCVLVVDSDHKQLMINKLKGLIVRGLRRLTDNPSLRLELVVEENTTAQQAPSDRLTPRDLLALADQQNPAFADLRQRLGLEIDWNRVG
jgi:hypothetical protein